LPPRPTNRHVLTDFLDPTLQLTATERQLIEGEILQLKQSKQNYIIAIETLEKEKGIKHIIIRRF
jgi:hypothetical protein